MFEISYRTLEDIYYSTKTNFRVFNIKHACLFDFMKDFLTLMLFKMQYLYKGSVCQVQGTEQNRIDTGVQYYNL
jgi:hypothetical protein